MYTIDEKSDENYFIILCNGEEMMKINKRINTLEQVKKFLGIED